MFTLFALGRAGALVAAATAALSLSVSPAQAGMSNQPKLPEAAAVTIRRAVDEILGTGALGTARPNLYIAVENNAATDLTDFLAGVVRDTMTYEGLASAFEDAAQNKTGADQTFITYNRARLHLLRARATASSPAKTAALRLGAAAAEALNKANTRDPAAGELIGDIYAEQNKLDQAAAMYNRLLQQGVPGGAPYVHLKIATLYHRANRYAEALTAYERGIRADAVGTSSRTELLHRLYQGLAALNLERNNEAAALEALSRSARVAQNPSAPYRLRLDVAQRLLRQGRAREVLAYAETALRFTPGDAAAQALRDQARAQTR